MTSALTDQTALDAAMPSTPSTDRARSGETSGHAESAPAGSGTAPCPTSDQQDDFNDPVLPPVILGDALLADPGYRPFDIFDGGDAPAAVIASCPHAGRGYPASMLQATALPIEALRGLEDFGVDCLLPDLCASGITTLVNRLARAYLDVNRNARALDSTMFDGRVSARPPCHHVRAGYGLIPKLTATRKPIYDSKLNGTEADARTAIAHTPYHAALAGLVESAMKRHNHVLLVDFHSMPGYDRLNNALSDIILGDGYGATLDRPTADAVTGFFREAGLSVSWNHPYAGGHITRSNGDARTQRRALQVEINRGLYMNGTDRLDPQRALTLRQTMAAFGRFLANHASRVTS